MSGAEGMFQRGNPFPSSPVVQLRVLAPLDQAGVPTPGPPVSVNTRAFTTLRRQVGEYLDRDEESSSRGRALALIGGLGLGKSHLASEAVAQVRARDRGIPLWVIDQPFPDMGEIYRDQLSALYDDHGARGAFEEVVSEFHAHVTAGVIEADPPAVLDDSSRRDFVERLREGELDSRKVAQALDLDEQLIHRHLRGNLREITSHRQFAAAFALLLDRRFTEKVWDWLKGGQPSDALYQRGITGAIDNTVKVFEAFTVFGFMHGRVGRPYVLVVDAVDDALEWSDPEARSFLGGFERLVNSYVNRGGLLVMCSLADHWSRFSAGLRERVLQIWPDRMDKRETEALVASYVSRGLPGGTRLVDPLAPFTLAALRDLREIGDGVPRQILKTCRQAWQLMEDQEETQHVIDDMVIHAAVRKLNEQRSAADVRDQVEQVLAQSQLRREHRPLETAHAADDALNDVDYWVRVDTGAYIGIMVVPSILLDAETRHIEAVVRAAEEVLPTVGCAILVLVNGVASPAMRGSIAQYTGTSPLLVGERNFRELLAQAIDVLAGRLNAARQRGSLEGLWSRLETMAAQQGVLLESVRAMDAKLEQRDRSGPADLPESVEARFAAAHTALELLADSPHDVTRALGVDASGIALVGELPRRLAFSTDQLTSLGLVAAVRALLAAFRDGVVGWRRAVAGRHGGLSEELTESLFVLCRSFEISMEVLPAFRTAPRDEAAVQEAGTTLSMRRADAQETLDRLPEAVRDELLADARDLTRGRAG